MAKPFEAVVILDREQGGREILAENGACVTSMFTISKLLEYLVKHEKITVKIAEEVRDYIKEQESQVAD